VSEGPKVELLLPEPIAGFIDLLGDQPEYTFGVDSPGAAVERL
jgi:hypothetical protein